MMADAMSEAKKSEDERLRKSWEESQQIDQPNGERRRNNMSSGSTANVNVDSSQPKVMPPQPREQKNFPPKPAFTSRSNSNESTDERFLDEDTWREQQQAKEDFDFRGPSRFKSNIMKLRKDYDPSFSPPFRDRGPPSVRPPPPPRPGGFMELESEEALIEAFEDMATFGNNNYNAPRNVDPSQQSSYEGSYFMDLSSTDDNEPGYPSPEVSPPPAPFPNQDPYSDNNDNNWSSSNPRTQNPEPNVRSPMGRGLPTNGSDWSRNYENNAPSRENTRRASMLGQGPSYLDNLSRRNEDSVPRSSRGSSSYLNNLSNNNIQQQQQQAVGYNDDPEFPERIQAAYVDWCQYYGKTYNEGRLRIFAANFLAVEKYHRETGVSLILNELADMTSDEFQQRKME
jgi:hypothetical protein